MYHLDLWGGDEWGGLNLAQWAGKIFLSSSAYMSRASLGRGVKTERGLAESFLASIPRACFLNTKKCQACSPGLRPHPVPL